MKQQIVGLVAILVVLLFAIPSGSANPGGHKMVSPDELEWTDVASLPKGAKLAVIEGPLDQEGPLTFRLKFPADYAIPPHWHPAIERVTVLKGAFHMGMGDKVDRSKGKKLTSGGVAIIPPESRHFAWTGKEETIVQLNATGPWAINYVNPGDDPRNADK